MKYTSISDIGLVRSQNQDHVAVVEKDTALLAVVCDGIGGGNAGEIASKMVTDMLRESFLETENFKSLDAIKVWFHKHVKEINKAVYHESLIVSSYHGMGTTLVACIVSRFGTVAFNIGDSRIYEYRNNELLLLSHDQTYAYEMYLRNEITLEDVDNHPRRNVLMNAVGIDETIRFETIEIESGWDLLLLSSDGLHGYVSKEDINSALNNESLIDVRNQLMTRAYEAGAFDNVSIVLLKGDKHD